MGLFDNTSASAAQAQDYGKVNFNDILGVVSKVLPFITALLPLLQKWYVAETHTESEKVLGERMLDQIPGLYQVLAKAGVFDQATLTFLQQHPHDAELTGRHYAHLEQVLPLAQALFTILFGVRIMDDDDLDALDYGVDAYYNVGTTAEQNILGTPLVRFHKHSDIPRAAVERAVMLKQKYFPISTYNKRQWDMNKFQEFPLVSPVPGLSYGTLYSGPIPFGGELLDGILIDAGPFLTEQQAGAQTDGGTNLPAASAVSSTKVWLLIAAAAVLGYVVYEKKLWK